MSDSLTTSQPTIRDQLNDNPYPLYAQFRMGGPVQWVDADRHWYVLGHQAAMQALRDTRLVASPGPDAATRARRRTLVQNTFTPAFVEQFRPHTEQLADTMLAEAGERGEFDLVGDLASPLAMSTATALLGLPTEQKNAVAAWVRDVSDSIAPAHGHRMGPREAGPVATAENVRDGLAALLPARRAGPRNDLISRLVRAPGPGYQGYQGYQGDDEVLDICAELLVSTHDSTVNLVSNAAAALLDNPLQLDRLRAEPSLITTAVEEFLRYDAPVQRITRVAAEDVDLGGKTIGRGQIVVVLVGAANRDPDAFDAPDLLDLSRSPNHHLAFGRGRRFCLGAPVARMAGQVAIGALVAQFPRFRLAGPAVRRPGIGGRGFTSFPLAVTPAEWEVAAGDGSMATLSTVH